MCSKDRARKASYADFSSSFSYLRSHVPSQVSLFMSFVYIMLAIYASRILAYVGFFYYLFSMYVLTEKYVGNYEIITKSVKTNIHFLKYL